MKRDALDRLFRSAAQAQPEPAPELSFPVQARILAAWRNARADATEAFLPLLRKAILASAAVSALAIAITLSMPAPTEPEQDLMAAVTNSVDEAIELALME
jgi:anti-sigma-K factor RskA